MSSGYYSPWVNVGIAHKLDLFVQRPLFVGVGPVHVTDDGVISPLLISYRIAADRAWSSKTLALALTMASTHKPSPNSPSNGQWSRSLFNNESDLQIHPNSVERVAGSATIINIS